MFALEHSGIKADLVIMAKSLAAGVPLAAVVGRVAVMDAVGPRGSAAPTAAIRSPARPD
jgi:4-aminobutyrate aminotransferase-like enzyme